MTRLVGRVAQLLWRAWRTVRMIPKNFEQAGQWEDDRRTREDRK